MWHQEFSRVGIPQRHNSAALIHPSLISSRRPNLNAYTPYTECTRRFPLHPSQQCSGVARALTSTGAAWLMCFSHGDPLVDSMRRSNCCSFPSSIIFTLFSLHFVHTLAAKHDRQRPGRLSQSRPRRRRQLLLCKGRQSCCCGRRCR